MDSHITVSQIILINFKILANLICFSFKNLTFSFCYSFLLLLLQDVYFRSCSINLHSSIEEVYFDLAKKFNWTQLESCYRNFKLTFIIMHIITIYE